jgi:hypothetical protein
VAFCRSFIVPVVKRSLTYLDVHGSRLTLAIPRTLGPALSLVLRVAGSNSRAGLLTALGRFACAAARRSWLPRHGVRSVARTRMHHLPFTEFRLAITPHVLSWLRAHCVAPARPALRPRAIKAIIEYVLLAGPSSRP